MGGSNGNRGQKGGFGGRAAVLEWSAFLEMEFFSFQVFGVSNFTSRSFAFGEVISVLFIYLAGLFWCASIHYDNDKSDVYFSHFNSLTFQFRFKDTSIQ